MGSTLYVGNLPSGSSADSVRARFAQCGEVADVSVVGDRETRRTRNFALVTMKTEAEAKHAMAELDGLLVDGRALHVSTAKDPSMREAPARASARTQRPVRVTHQFRERYNITYELDCSGTALVVRTFASPEGAAAEWRVEVRARCADRLAASQAPDPTRPHAQ